MRVALVSPGLTRRNERLQPHATLLAMGRELGSRGIDVAAISDGADDGPTEEELGGVPVRRLGSARAFRWSDEADTAVAREIRGLGPDLVLWHVSLTTLLHQKHGHRLSAPVLGLLTTPAQTPADILNVGAAKLSSNVDLILPQLIGALVPGRVIRRAIGEGGLTGVICLSEASRRYLIERGAAETAVFVAPPAVAPLWLNGGLTAERRKALRERAGCAEGDFLLTYFGSPAPVRGIFTLVDAVARVAPLRPSLRLLVLARRWDDEWGTQSRRLAAALDAPRLANRARLIDGYVNGGELRDWVTASDAVCLPFELLPSDVPLSVLEAMAAGQLVVTTPVASIPELVADGRGLLCPPRAPAALADTLLRVIDGEVPAAAIRDAGQAYVRAHRRPRDMGDALLAAFEKVGAL